MKKLNNSILCFLKLINIKLRNNYMRATTHGLTLLDVALKVVAPGPIKDHRWPNLFTGFQNFSLNVNILLIALQTIVTAFSYCSAIVEIFFAQNSFNFLQNSGILGKFCFRCPNYGTFPYIGVLSQQKTDSDSQSVVHGPPRVPCIFSNGPPRGLSLKTEYLLLNAYFTDLRESFCHFQQQALLLLFLIQFCHAVKASC